MTWPEAIAVSVTVLAVAGFFGWVCWLVWKADS